MRNNFKNKALEGSNNICNVLRKACRSETWAECIIAWLIVSQHEGCSLRLVNRILVITFYDLSCDSEVILVSENS